MELNNLMSISPVDGRYRNITEKLSEYFSEYAYIKYRVYVEIAWFKYILKSKDIIGINDDISILDAIISNFNIKECERIKEIEKTTNHDVKAIEYYVRENVRNTFLSKYESFIHFACTSEDINNIAYNLMIKGALKGVIIPSILELIQNVKEEAIILKDTPMLSHTHGQPATPTTVGKELAVFVWRWKNILEKIENIKLTGKFNGATGNFAAHKVAYENVDWINFAKEFVESFGFKFNPLVTQIESHDVICELCSYIKLFNNITLDFNQDMWTYISKGYFRQKTVIGEVGSSVMPHKVNPINHENSMANIHMCNSIIDNFTSNLQISRMQRDLSDSSCLRNLGVMFSHFLISIKQTSVAFSKMEIDKFSLEQDLDKNPEVIAEAIQTILRKNGYNDAYEKLKEMTRGKNVTLKDIDEYIAGLEIDFKDKQKLLCLTPQNYIGEVSKLVEYIM